MPHGMLQCLHQLWMLKVMEASGIITALSAYGYELSYIALDGIRVEKENEKLEYKTFL